MRFRYQVDLADEFGFDFGGDKAAGFVAKGDAIAFAIELRRRSGAEARVRDSFARGAEVFRARVVEAAVA